MEPEFGIFLGILHQLMSALEFGCWKFGYLQNKRILPVVITRSAMRLEGHNSPYLLYYTMHASSIHILVGIIQYEQKTSQLVNQSKKIAYVRQSQTIQHNKRGESPQQ